MRYPPSERARDALLAMQENIGRAQSLVRGATALTLAEDWARLYAVRCLEIISEASRRLTEDILARHPDIDWRRLRDAGNVYRHVYDALDASLILNTVLEALPPLSRAVDTEISSPEAP
jgi:uncharacterized protein with HEPN domain